MKFAVRIPDGRYCCCDDPERVIVAHDADSLRAAVNEIERLQTQGYYVAGWISYEAAQAINDRLPVLPSGDFPLLKMLASRTVEMKSLPGLSHSMLRPLQPGIDQALYEARCQQLLDYILAGDVYQANFSFRCELEGIDDPFRLFCQLEAEHPMPYSAYIETDDWQVVSSSPELFLHRDANQIISEPMKGTASRKLSFADDEQERLDLAKDIKNRAENIMIVDLMRNDLGRICETGSISVPFKFKPVRFHSLHQLISRVEGTLKRGTSLFEILRATFPAGSITGAPKVRAMEIISELELGPRKAYTGSVGLFRPGGDFTLNVAIRTLSCKQHETYGELGIGSGVVANSERRLEWQECLLKGEFLSYRQQHNEIFETILWQGSFVWLDDHLKRLEKSCAYWLMPFSREETESRLLMLAETFTKERYRVRLAVRRDGQIEIDSIPLSNDGWGKPSLTLLVSGEAVDATSPYQYHKTDVRSLYDVELIEARKKGYDEVLFLNATGDLVEGAITNLFFRQEGAWFTPAVSEGLLPGIWRQHQRQKMNAKEAALNMANLNQVDAISIGNSLRMEGKVDEIWFNGALIWQESSHAAH